MMLRLKNIRISFTNARKEVFNLLNGVDLDVPHGKITALVGGNGAGKTTLFNIISGFAKDYSGEVYIDGKEVRRIPAYQISKQGVGRLFQGRQLMPDLTLMENMKLASEDATGDNPIMAVLCPKRVAIAEKEKEKKAIKVLEKLFGEGNKYLDMLDRNTFEFSYGEQRLIAIASLLMSENKLLLLDEPTSGVNPIYIDTIKKIIDKMVKEDGLTVLLIEHNMHFVREMADFCAYLDDGLIRKMGSVKDVLDDTDVKNSYLGV